LKNSNSAYTLRGLTSLISAGISLPQALEVTSRTLSNSYYKNALISAAEKVRKGEKLSKVLSSYSNIYSPLIIQMVAVGEESGEMVSLLEKLADFYEEEVSNLTKNLASVIEPILLLLIGGQWDSLLFQ
jgi:type IV pilus assembly protein PilC